MDKNKILEVLVSKKDSFNIHNFVLFGSFAKKKEREESDIDIAYILKDGYKLSFSQYLKLENDLEQSFEKKVDLVNYRKLNPLIKLHAKEDFIYV